MKQKCLHEVSKSILLEETIELRQILELIYNSKDEVSNNEIYIALIPIISSVCLGWLEIFKEEDFKMDVFKIGDYNFEELLKSSRIGLKLYSDKKLSKAGKLLKKNSLEFKAILQTDYNALQKLFVYMFGQCDFGVFSINNIPFGNTSQQFLYFEDFIKFEENVSFKTWLLEIEQVIFEYSKHIGFIVEYIIKLFNKSNSISKGSKIKIDSNNMSHKDYFLIDEKRRNILQGNLPMEVQLQLFNVLCQNNFITSVLSDVFNSKGILFYRSKIQTYLVSVNYLIKVHNKYSEYLKKEYEDDFKQIFTVKNKFFSNNCSLRNNIFHYKIQAFPELVFLNSSSYFIDMVEYETKINFKNLMKIVDDEIDRINSIIYKIVNYDGFYLKN